jgi:hypothetical protein
MITSASAPAHSDLIPRPSVRNFQSRLKAYKASSVRRQRRLAFLKRDAA